MNKKNRTYREYLLSLLSLLNAKEEIPTDDTDQVLTEAGYNPDEISKKFQAIANKALKKSPHNWRNRAHIDHEQAKSSFLNSNLTNNNTRQSRSELLETISALLAQENLNIAPAYRNLTAQTDEDLESLLKQLRYIVAQRSKKRGD
jgi:hypothetical protein